MIDRTATGVIGVAFASAGIYYCGYECFFRIRAHLGQIHPAPLISGHLRLVVDKTKQGLGRLQVFKGHMYTTVTKLDGRVSTVQISYPVPEGALVAREWAKGFAPDSSEVLYLLAQSGPPIWRALETTIYSSVALVFTCFGLRLVGQAVM